MPQKDNFEKRRSKIWPFSCLHLCFPQKFHLNIFIASFLYHEPLPFSTRAPLLPLPRWTMSVDDVGLITCLLGTLNSMVTLTLYLWYKLNSSWDELIANCRFYKTLGQLHGPWCKQLVSVSKSKWLHVVIFDFPSLIWDNVPHIPLKWSVNYLQNLELRLIISQTQPVHL